MPGQGLHILGAVTKWRQMERDYVEPVEEILPKPSGLKLLFQLFVGGRHEPDINSASSGSAHRQKFAGLDDPEEFGLDSRTHVSNLVQKERAAAGFFQQPFPGGQSTGEGPPHMPKELTFQQRFGESRAVEREERPLPAGAVVVDGCGNQLLAGPRCA